MNIVKNPNKNIIGINLKATATCNWTSSKTLKLFNARLFLMLTLQLESWARNLKICMKMSSCSCLILYESKLLECS